MPEATSTTFLMKTIDKNFLGCRCVDCCGAILLGHVSGILLPVNREGSWWGAGAQRDGRERAALLRPAAARAAVAPQQEFQANRSNSLRRRAVGRLVRVPFGGSRQKRAVEVALHTTSTEPTSTARFALPQTFVARSAVWHGFVLNCLRSV